MYSDIAMSPLIRLFFQLTCRLIINLIQSLQKKYANFLLNYSNFISMKTSTNIIFISSVLLQIVNLQCNGFSVNAHVSIEQSVGHFKMTILSHFSHSGDKIALGLFENYSQRTSINLNPRQMSGPKTIK